LLNTQNSTLQVTVMKQREGTFNSLGNLDLYYQSWQPELAIKGVVAIVHGLGGHSGQFSGAAAALVAQGYAVYALDLRGHGRSPGQRGHINTWREFRADIAAFLALIEPSCACFLWGHSLGGTIALDYALRSPHTLQGLILTAPALSQISLSPVKLTVGKLLSRTWPRFSLKLGIPRELCAQDTRICAAYAQDPLRHEYGSARLATEFFATVAWIHAHAAQLNLPLLLMHGSADRVTLPAGSRAFFAQVTEADKKYYEYPDNLHDLHVDVSAPTMFADLRSWLDQHVPSAINGERVICQI
jgi:alpha-beta hydrolase superfamily lysophospholipase